MHIAVAQCPAVSSGQWVHPTAVLLIVDIVYYILVYNEFIEFIDNIYMWMPTTAYYIYSNSVFCMSFDRVVII